MVAGALVALGVAALVVVVADGQDRNRDAQSAVFAPPIPDLERQGQRPTAATPRACVEGSAARTDPVGTLAVRVVRPTHAFRRPGAEPLMRFGLLNINGVGTVFSVRATRVDAGCGPAWYRVQLPARPNGLTGWVRAADVEPFVVSTRVLVDLSDRRVSVFRGDEELLTTEAAIGSHATPTPIGHYYVNQRLRAADPTGPWGPGGVGISAFSPVLTDWAQGGPIAIHGTNTPRSIGQRVSNGCIRVSNYHLLKIWDLAPEGTPVQIRA